MLHSCILFRSDAGCHALNPQRHFRHLVDPFSLLDAALVSDVVNLFHETRRAFDPHYVYQDCVAAMAHLARGQILARLRADPGRYIQDKPRLGRMLSSLRDAGRKTFLLTNSDFEFVDVVMQHLLREQLAQPDTWASLFDVVMCGANRPHWWHVDAPFRSLNTATSAPPARRMRAHASNAPF